MNEWTQLHAKHEALRQKITELAWVPGELDDIACEIDDREDGDGAASSLADRIRAVIAEWDAIVV